MFLSWCGKEAGFEESEYGFFSYTGYWISWFKNKDGRVDSAGIIEKNGWTKLSVIKGSLNNQVARVKYVKDDKRILGYGSFYEYIDDSEQSDDNGVLSKPRLGIDVGIYFVTQAITTQEAIEEAEFVIDKIKNYNVTYPVAIDTEQASLEERSKDLTKN